MATIRTEFPNAIKEIENLWIPLSDGTKLAARMWLPENANDAPIPAIMEYIPYCKRDGTSARDEAMHPYFAGHGYAAIRVDMRGSGESDGILEDEYLQLELDDACEVIQWLSEQPWCDGNVGMMGKSWGGFNGLQVAALQPPALKCIITVASTDDRYADDVHYMGGALLFDNPLWAGAMLMRNPRPADPAIIGDDYLAHWKKRLDAADPWIIKWISQQERNDYWKHGSVCEDYSRIQVPVYAIGGWGDGYSNAIPRLVENLSVFSKAWIGPWGHQYPHQAWPFPQAGFLQDAIRWWDHWLKGKDTGMMEEPRVQAYAQEFYNPEAFVESRPGRWIATGSWPPVENEDLNLHLGKGTLTVNPQEAASLSIKSPLSTGTSCTEWMSYGHPSDLGEARDQREDDIRSLCFETDPLSDDLEIFGAPRVRLKIASDKPVANVIARLNEIAPDGTSLRTTFGVLNLTHRDSHEHPSLLEPGQFYDVEIKLNDTAHHFAKGNRIRLAISSNLWPVIWPAPEEATLTLQTDQCTLILPERKGSGLDHGLKEYPPAESHPLDPRTVLRKGWGAEISVTRDTRTQKVTVISEADDGRTRLDKTGWEHGGTNKTVRSIIDGDANSVKITDRSTIEFGRENGPQFDIIVEQTMWSDRTHFHVQSTIDAKLDGNSVHSKSWLKAIERTFV